MKSKQVGSFADTNGTDWTIWRKSCCRYTLTAKGRRVQMYDPSHVLDLHLTERHRLSSPLASASAVRELLAVYGITPAAGALA